MSELYMIVLQGKEELGNDPEAIKLWAELSGVDIDSIDENTPFDIDMADRLLRTLPEVMEKMKERAMKDVESLEERLKKVLESRQEKEEAEDLLQKLDRELEETPIIPEATEKEAPQPAQEIEIPSGPLFAEGIQEEEPQEVQEVAPVEETPTAEEISEPVVSGAETEVKAQYDIVEQPVEISVPGWRRGRFTSLRVDGPASTTPSSELWPPGWLTGSSSSSKTAIPSTVNR